MPDDVEITWDGPKVMAALRGAEMEGLQLAGEHLLQVSSQQAPLEEGDLARSGEVSTDEAARAAAVSFDRSYAVRQHEDMTYRHDEGKKAKYLEDPMNEETETMLALIAATGRRRTGG